MVHATADAYRNVFYVSASVSLGGTALGLMLRTPKPMQPPTAEPPRPDQEAGPGAAVADNTEHRQPELAALS